MRKSSRRKSDPHATKTPRRHDAFYLLVGFTLICLGTLLGLSAGLPKCHRAFAMKSFARTMDITQLQSEGLGDNAFVHLTNVDFDRPPQTSPLEQVTSSVAKLANPAELGSDPELIRGKIEAMKQDIAGTLQQAPIGSLLEESLRGIALFSKDTGRTQGAPVVTLARNSSIVKSAREQIDRFNEVRGYLCLDTSAAEVGMIKTLTAPDAMDRGTTQWLAAIKQAGKSNENAVTTYRIEPLETPPTKAMSVAILAASLGMFSLGLVLCGSCSLSIWTWLFLPAPSMFSLLGIPLRRGRGGSKMRFAYSFVGVSLLMVGGYEIYLLGGFGQPESNSLHHSLGFLIFATGFAAVLGTIANARTPKPEAIPTVAMPKPTENSPSAILRYNADPIEDEPTASKAELGSEKPRIKTYQDPVLMAAMDDNCSSLTMQYIDRLSELGFSNPAFVRLQSSQSLPSIGLLLGCNHTVLAEVTDNTVNPTIRMTSILHDGLPIITVSETVAKSDQAKFATTGVYQSAPHQPLKAMLAKHLQQAIRMSEKRDSNIVTIDRDEKYEVCLLSRRAFADVRSQYEESNIAVGPASYERFAFPPQPIEELTVTS
ncbi:hypothetical protein SH528x_001385 [Novipirellula sp. SH528]|uniref:hypothetical protein n=1 Tax=Novipirellula sp. SH528 TaxID=3454466 RepID=UPI003F9FAEF3